MRMSKKDQEIRTLVAGLMAEHRERRKHLVECPHCWYGKTWRPEVLSGTYSFDSDEPMMTDCKVCEGEGFLPKKLTA
jgi:hypothetical protein